MSQVVLLVLFLAAAPGLPVASAGCTLQIDPRRPPLHRINPHFMGCHSDAGYAHQARGLSAELLNGNAFEPVPDAGNFAPGTRLNDTTANMTYPPQQAWSLDRAAKVSGSSLMPSGRALVLGPGPGSATNRGFGNEGLPLQAGKVYEGYLVARSAEAVEVTVTLEPRGSRVGAPPLASAAVSIPAGNWSKLPFSLTPNASVTCAGITDSEVLKQGIGCPPNGRYLGRDGEKMSDLTAHVCVACGGQLSLSLSGSGTVEIGFASLMAGEWGRFKGLPVRASSAAALQQMGVSMIRFGGSYVTSAPMPWTRWRGPPWLRPSAVDGIWRHGLMSGWGLFEMVDLANAIGAEPLLTIDPYGNDVGMLADLVEYCWGGTATSLGKQRIADGHPEPYNVSYFELGNEEYNNDFVEQVQAMEAKAKAIGVPRKIYYLFPDNAGMSAADAAKAKALGLGDQLLVDLHNRAEGGAGEIDKVVKMTNMEDWGVLNGETNCGDHTVRRMLDEAADLNMYFSRHLLAERIKGRTASFCMERSGFNEGGLNDQGLAFFLPNVTWLQPPGYVHAMVKDTMQPLALNFTQHDTAKGVGHVCPFGLERGLYSAQISDDRKTIVARVAWDKPIALNVTIDLLGSGVSTPMEVTSMSYPNLTGANTPSQPQLIAPKRMEVGAVSGKAVLVPPNSYTVFVAKLR